jgi:hypothetical protein
MNEDGGGTLAVDADVNIGTQSLDVLVTGKASEPWKWRGVVTEVKVL